MDGSDGSLWEQPQMVAPHRGGDVSRGLISYPRWVLTVSREMYSPLVFAFGSALSIFRMRVHRIECTYSRLEKARKGSGSH
jgi:hypothetical protein